MNATTTTAGFDFSAVAVETAEMPKTGAGRPRNRKDNPFTEVLAKSYEDFTADREAGRSITLPGKNVGEAVYLIRQASDDLGVGARIVTRTASGDPIAVKDCKDKRGNIVVLFSAKNRKQASDAATAEASGDADSE